MAKAVWHSWTKGGRKSLAAVLSLLLAVAPAYAQEDQAIAVPSGQQITLTEQFLEPQENGEMWFRMRFLAPQIGTEDDQMTYEKSEADFLYLCQSVALKQLDEAGKSAQAIIITLMDRPVDFGASDPQATQFFEAFRPENATCMWEDL